MARFKTEFISKQIEVASSNRETIVDFSEQNGGDVWLMNIMDYRDFKKPATN